MGSSTMHLWAAYVSQAYSSSTIITITARYLNKLPCPTLWLVQNLHFGNNKKKPLPISKKKAADSSVGDLEELVNQAKESQVLDCQSFDQYVDLFEKALIANTDARQQHSNEPEEFFESEVTLYELLVQMAAATTDAELLEKMTNHARFMSLVLALIIHPNEDISGTLLKFLTEATDNEVENRTDAVVSYAFVRKLSESGIFGILLDRVVDVDVDVEDNSDEILSLLELLKNLMFWSHSEASPSEALIEGWSIWLLTRIPSGSPYQRSICTEILADLLDTFSESHVPILTNNGMSILLNVLKEYSTNDSTEDKEFSANVADIICTLLLGEGKTPFKDAMGFEICFGMISGMKFGRLLATQLLSFALSASNMACEEFVERGGLKYIFPLFMAIGSAEYAKRYKEFDASKDNEYICSAIASLFRFGAKYSERLVAKFTAEKRNRLVELVQQSEKIKVDDSTEKSCLENCCFIVAHLAEHGVMLSEVSKTAKSVLEEQLATWGTVEDDDSKRIVSLISNLY